MAYPPNQVPDAPMPLSMMVQADTLILKNRVPIYFQIGDVIAKRVVGAIVDKATKGGKDGDK